MTQIEELEETITPEDVALVKAARAGALATIPVDAPDHLVVSVEDRWAGSEGGKVLTISGLSRAQVYLLSKVIEEETKNGAWRDIHKEWGVGPSREDDFAGYAKASAQFAELLQVAPILKAAIS